MKTWLGFIAIAAAAVVGPAGAADGDMSFNGMIEQYRHRAADTAEWHNPIMPGATGTAYAQSATGAQSLRTFNAYLAYLGMRMRVDAGPPGPLLKNDRGTDPFDRYLEEINYRIQALIRAEDAIGR